MEPALRGPELTPGKRREAIAMHRDGKSFAAIGRELEVNADTVRKIWNRYEEHGNTKSAPRSGRPTKLDNRDRRHLKRYVKKNWSNRHEPLRDITNTLNLDVHPDTLRKEIQAFGLNHRKQCRRPYLSPKQKEARLKFAEEHIHWTIEDWRRVIFTDEMGLQTGANEGIVWVWRAPEEEYSEDCCGVTHKSGFKKIKVWGAIRYNALSKLVILKERGEREEGRFSGKDYMEQVMDEELFDFLASSMEELGDVLIMEDGAGYHEGAATKRREQYKADGIWQGWGPHTWPANSPDLNPIENLWHILRSNIQKRVPRPMKKEDLVAAVQEEWAKLDMAKVNSLIESMPRRLQAVIDAKGGSTKY